ncbi:hypothetical protein DFH86_002577 [Clostridium saccharobutylicum]|nr:hypothetical protein [Clostridium saccharobutylicum]NSB52143.1 hypothetical protein [Clostridium saccharobutylicum]
MIKYTLIIKVLDKWIVKVNFNIRGMCGVRNAL